METREYSAMLKRNLDEHARHFVIAVWLIITKVSASVSASAKADYNG